MDDYITHRDLKYRYHEFSPPSFTPWYPELQKMYGCPCCHYPTVGEPEGFEICSICGWEDDGTEGPGPNHCFIEEFRSRLPKYWQELYPPRFAEVQAKMQLLDAFMKEQDLVKRGEILAEAFRWRERFAPPKPPVVLP